MKFDFENQGTSTYLVYKIDAKDTVDTMSLGMLTNNRIAGLAPALFTQMDTTKYIKYNVSSKITVKQLLQGPVNRKRLMGVFSGIVDAMLSAEEYMIDTGSILLDMEYIFADVSTCETILICLPITAEQREVIDLGAMFKNIVFSTQFDQTENCDYVAKLINYLNSTPVFSLVDFKNILEEIKSGEHMSTASAVQPSQPMAQQQSSMVQQPTSQAQQPMAQAQSPMAQQQLMAQQPSVQKSAQPSQQMIAQPVRTEQSQPVTNPFNMPPAGGKGNKKGAGAEVPVGAAEEKKMSMFGLLTHYNKENAQLYKEQKQRKKEAAHKQNGAVQPSVIQPQAGFAIPGQSPQKPQAPQKPQQPMTQMQQPVTQMQQPMTQMQQPMAQQQPTTQQQSVTQPQQPMAQQPMAQSQQPMAQSQQSFMAQMMQSAPANFGDTTVLGAGIGETTVLGVSESVNTEPYIIRKKTGEKITIDKPVFRIGKEKSYVDYFVSDNTAISRSHVNIVAKDGKYYIVDTNSTNHTYMNGQMLQSNQEYSLMTGAVFRLANEDFEFRI